MPFLKNIRMAKTRLIILLFASFFILPQKRAMGAPEVPPESYVNACSAMVYDLDNDAVLFEQNADQPIPPASLTKVMSMFLAMDFMKAGHARTDTPVLISSGAASAGGSSMGIKAGESVSFGKLLRGMAVSSGNDASFAIAEHVGGSAPAFVRMMNAKAASLGMNDSHFANPHGLPHPEQYTTARDMLTLARAYLLNYPEALSLHNLKYITHGGYTSWNKNPLLGQYPGADGLKSGWIRASGYNLIFTASRDGRRVLAVIMGAPDTWARGAEACRLLDAGFMVCGNNAVSVASALDMIPYDEGRIDPRKTGRDAGLLKVRAAAQKRAAVKASSGKKLQARQAGGKKAAAGKKRSGVKSLAASGKAGSGKSAAKTASLKKRAAAAKSAAAKKIQPKRGSHAERKGSKARRG